MKLFGVAVAGSVIALILGLTAVVNIWNEGYLGAGRAISGVLASMIILAVPLWSLPGLLSLPRLNDVTTDPDNPPAFIKIAEVRQGRSNGANYTDAAAALQTQSYPDLQPVAISRPPVEVYSAVREVIKNLDWRIVAETPPEEKNAGLIEAVDRSTIFGFTDDVVIRVKGEQRSSRIDVRSASRYGQHDLGRNAGRIRDFFAAVQTRLTEIEQTERMERVMASREAREKENSKAKKAKNTQQAARPRRDEEEDKNEEPAAPPTSESKRYYEPEGRDRVYERALSRAEARSERRRTRRRRQRERTRAARRFWEQLSR